MSLEEMTGRTPAPGGLLTKVPGRARPQKQVLALFEEEAAELRQRYKPAFWVLFIPNAEEMYGGACSWNAAAHGRSSPAGATVFRMGTATRTRSPDTGSRLARCGAARITDRWRSLIATSSGGSRAR
jgi:hypothetical protein